jgi:hypothetical protein
MVREDHELAVKILSGGQIGAYKTTTPSPPDRSSRIFKDYHFIDAYFTNSSSHF